MQLAVVAKILIVDDEAPLLRNLASFLSSFRDEFDVQTAATGEEALDTLTRDEDIDLLLTDVRLPGIDGIELIRTAASINPDLRLLVMTAFPSREIKRNARAVGALHYLEKPLDLNHLRQTLNEVADSPSGWSGSVGGLDIFDFTQLFAMSGKTTAIEVRGGDRRGHLVFRDGRLVHASTRDLAGDAAFYDMASWIGGTFAEVPTRVAASLEPNISSTTNHLMIEAARLRDERDRDPSPDSQDPDLDPDPEIESDITNPDLPSEKEKRTMAIKDHLSQFETIEGFQGAAIFTAQGEMLDGIAKGKVDIKTIGMFANNALLNAQKATDQMGVGRGNLMQIRAPQATVLMRCLNEATDFAATKEGKAHIHAVVVMDPEGNTAMASMILDKVIASVAEEVR
jgi:CheY-like chemotaxis protein/predicted regulator of Ras-like GTPase activity (Roadblock/LC7/MglB family)